jgi:predicted RNA-binding protein YlqC (UPF0109 family)
LDAEAGIPATAGGGETAIKDLLRFVVRAMVDHPDDVGVEFFSDEDGDCFVVRANDDDLGRLIGKNGQTAKALQTIINANGRKVGRRYQLDIIGLDDDLDDADDEA